MLSLVLAGLVIKIGIAALNLKASPSDFLDLDKFLDLIGKKRRYR
jgi:hypothetical protein